MVLSACTQVMTELLQGALHADTCSCTLRQPQTLQKLRRLENHWLRTPHCGLAATPVPVSAPAMDPKHCLALQACIHTCVSLRQIDGSQIKAAPSWRPRPLGTRIKAPLLRPDRLLLSLLGCAALQRSPGRRLGAGGNPLHPPGGQGFSPRRGSLGAGGSRRWLLCCRACTSAIMPFSMMAFSHMFIV